MSLPMTVGDFLADDGGRLFVKIVNDPALGFQRLLDFLQDPQRIQRMKDAEMHHNRPALAGVVRELEAPQQFGGYLASLSPKQRQRLNQCVGYIVKLIMLEEGWVPRHSKGSLGRRDDKSPDAYENTASSLSRYFIRAERYTPEPEGE